MTRNHEILDVGDNPSDHLPIKLEILCNISTESENPKQPVKKPSLKWEKCSEEQKSSFSNRLDELLHLHPSVMTHCDVVHCQRENCAISIQNEYDSLVSIISQADKVLPRHKPGVQKNWWTDELTALRNQSVEIHRIWQLEGKPRSGPTNSERCRVRAAYKKAIKLAQKKPKQSCWNRMHRSFVSKSQTEFWKSWKQLYSKSQPGLHTVVNGVSSKKEIADSFKEHFIKVSKPNNIQRVEHLEASFTEKYLKATNSHANCSCSSYQMSLQNILDAVFSMKKGKCGDDDSIHAEHFFNAPVSLLCRLQRLFNGMLMHECVPNQFQKGTIVPIVKDNTGDKGDLNNYRGITIAPIISKIFEHALRIIFQPFLSTLSYQLGFKKNSSTSLAIQCLKETINYYTSNGSNVYCSFLDASKAFDRLVHAGLFTKLLERNVPLIFLNLIKAWYSNLQCRV